MDEFCEHFERAIPDLRKRILEVFEFTQTKAGFRSVWEYFENVINPILIEVLSKQPLSIPSSDIKAASSKSVYPDLKVKHKGNIYAIDVKSGEDIINPWYDIGRLDTYEEKHLQKYKAEYCVTVKWRGRPQSKVIDVFVEPTFKSVGYKSTYKGVLYRPYDGKLRPKSWADFEGGKSYWENIEHFRQGLYAARNFRRSSLIAEWYKEMDETERRQIKEILDNNDKGKT